MKKRIISLLAMISILCLLSGILSGCGKKAAENTLTMMFPTELRAEDCERFVKNLGTKFPQIHFDVEYMDGDNTARYQLQRLRNDDATDIVWYNEVMDQELASSKLVDLSGYSFVKNFDSSILSLFDVDGKIYQIPGPVAVQTIVVNKTLLAELGLEVPDSFEELVTAVETIHQAYPEMNPLAIGMEKLTATMRVLNAMNESGFLSTPAGTAWKKEYMDGKASIAEGFSEGLDMFARLIDAGAFDPEENVKIGDMRAQTLLSRETAMCTNMIVPRQVTWIYDPALNEEADSSDEFVLIPFYGMESDLPALGVMSHSTWGINKRLEEKGNESKLENAMKVMEYLSTEEAQSALCPNEAYTPALRTLKNDTRPEYLKELWKKGKDGVKFFNDRSDYEDIEDPCINIIWDAMKAGSSKGMKKSFIETADRLHQDALEKKDSVGVIQDTLSPEETMKLYQNAILEKSGADFAMTTATGYENGTRNPHGLCPIKLYAGDVNRLMLGAGVGYWLATVQTTFLTGTEVKQLLADGKRSGGGEYDYLGESAPFLYSAAGLDVARDKDG